MRKIGVDCQLPENRVRLSVLFWLFFLVFFDVAELFVQANTEAIYQYRIENTPTFVFSETITSAIKQLWHDPIISTVMDHRSEFYLMDSAA